MSSISATDVGNIKAKDNSNTYYHDEHYEGRLENGSVPSTQDLEKHEDAGNGMKLSTTEDRDNVVTTKTWAVVVVCSYSLTKLDASD